MNRKMAFTALSVAITLVSASAAMAGHKGDKHAQEFADPREVYKIKGTNHGMACDVDPACNGWAQWYQGTQAGKKYKQPANVIGYVR
jgi:hypothetical protein